MIEPGPSTLLRIADAVVLTIRDEWRPQGEDTVERVYLPDVDKPEALAGRRVWVFPIGKGQVDIADRGDDAVVHRVGVVITERCEPGEWPPSRDWCDERVSFVEALYQRLGDARDEALFPPALRDYYPEEAEIVVAFDPDTLRSRQLYWAYLEFGFRGDE